MSTLLKRFRIFAVLALALFGAFAFTNTAYAAGTETWYKGTGPEEQMLVTNNNLTPVKTLGDSGKLHLIWNVTPVRDGVNEPTYYPPIQVTLQLREAYTGRVLDQYLYIEGLHPDSFSLYGGDLPAGTKVQFYVDVSSQYNPPGPYRKALINYHYVLE